MTKTRAYTSQYGNDMVTAAQVGKLRNLKFNGQPTGIDYFSTHKPGKRKPVKHVMREGRWFFAYIEAGDKDLTEDGGESLNHLLFKEALCSLEHTTLSLYELTVGKPKKWRDAYITITDSAKEKSIARSAGDAYRADAYIEFETTDVIGVKWEGRLCLEVRHTHAVDAAKQSELRDLDVPVVEVEIPDIFTYKFEDEDTDDDKEEAHRRYIKRVLESENGFLKGTVLSNPSSKKYLEIEVDTQREQISKLKQSENKLGERLNLAEKQLKEAHHVSANQSIQIQSLGAQLLDTKSKLGSANTSLTQLNQTKTSLEEQLSDSKAWRRTLFALCALFGVSLVGLVGWIAFI
jgi:hypothetical protein